MPRPKTDLRKLKIIVAHYSWAQKSIRGGKYVKVRHEIERRCRQLKMSPSRGWSAIREHFRP